MKNSSESLIDSPSPDSRPGAISGKRMTVVVLLTLLVTGGLFYWVTLAYATYNAARRETDRTWRELAPELSARYRAFDQSIALAKDAGQIKPELIYEWAAARDEFSSTAQTLHKIEAAQKLEQLAAAFPREVPAGLPPSAELERRVANYSAAAAHQRSVGRSIGSRLLKTMLNLPEPTEFQLAR